MLWQRNNTILTLLLKMWFPDCCQSLDCILPYRKEISCFSQICMRKSTISISTLFFYVYYSSYKICFRKEVHWFSFLHGLFILSYHQQSESSCISITYWLMLNKSWQSVVRVGGRGRKMANGKENYISNYVAENQHLFKLYESKTAV